MTKQQEADRLDNERKLVARSIQNIRNVADKLTEDTVIDFKPRYCKLNELEVNFRDIQVKIIDFNSKTNNELKLDVEKIQTEVEESIFDIRVIFDKLSRVNQEDPVKSKLNTSCQVNVPLPKLTIPKFGGQIGQWPEFKNLYDSLVHQNSNLSDVEKFQYLRSLLVSDAAALVCNYPLSNELYMTAYEVLQNRYNNKRRLAQHYIDKLLNFSKASTHTASNLQHFLTTHTSAINSFRALDIDDTADYMLLHLTLRNLDSTTRKAFEKQCSSNFVPTYRSLIQFVAETCKAL